MSVHDKKYFPSDVRKFNWDSYCYNYNLGLLRYIGNEDLDDFEPARRRMRKFRLAHKFVLVVYYTILATLYYFVLHMVGINGLVRSFYHRVQMLVSTGY